MCTHATQRVVLNGSGKVNGAWLPVGSANVYVDHPYSTPLDHTLNIDVFADADDRMRHVALELSLDSAEALLSALTTALRATRSGLG